MYVCKQCGNKKDFCEHNCSKTYLTLDEETGEIISTEDKWLDCAEVICSRCNASSKDGNILDRNTNEPIQTR